MQAVCSTSAIGVRLPVARRTASRTACRAAPVCRAQTPAKAVAAAAALPAFLASHPALALVDDRLGGEGTGKILGIGGGEQWVVLAALTAIWALYFIGGKDLGGDKGEDSGLSL